MGIELKAHESVVQPRALVFIQIKCTDHSHDPVLYD